MPRKIAHKCLSGEPLDGSGRICIHLFVQDEAGKFTEPHMLHPGEGKKLVAKPTRGHLACDPNRSTAPQIKDDLIIVTARTDSPEAVTCPKCLKYIKEHNYGSSPCPADQRPVHGSVEHQSAGDTE